MMNAAAVVAAQALIRPNQQTISSRKIGKTKQLSLRGKNPAYQPACLSNAWFRSGER